MVRACRRELFTKQNVFETYIYCLLNTICFIIDHHFVLNFRLFMSFVPFGQCSSDRVGIDKSIEKVLPVVSSLLLIL